MLLPDNLFYNTNAPGIVVVLNRDKRHRGEVILINASQLFTKGRPKNELGEEHTVAVAELYDRWQTVPNRCAVVPTSVLVANDYNLSPSKYAAARAEEASLSLEEAVRLLHDAETERGQAIEEVWRVLAEMGVA